MNRRRIFGLCFLSLAACGSPSNEPEPPSDPTDYFYREPRVEGVSNPLIRWHEQEPGRYFQTSLRPTQMHGALPTAYLSRITRNYQPWAKQIYDVANLSFDYSSLAPLAPAKGFGWGISGDGKEDDVLLEIGGWQSSFSIEPKTMQDLYKDEIEARDGIVVVVSDRGRAKYYLDEPETSNLDGQPVWVDCFPGRECSVDLTIPQEMAGLLPLHEGSTPPTRGTTGAKLRVTFHPDRISEWPEVRRKAVCFAALSIPGLDSDLISPMKGLHCHDVREAITKTIED